MDSILNINLSAARDKDEDFKDDTKDSSFSKGYYYF